ncbi:hypothetical protein A8709_11735 [Paenibacillus pectinilyticus]|uniref:Uncharacterized protein n=1 Tax=Paenibacillus pectinilyticus TaxID=512399 RepID=A0A1C1A2R6_9BACL|nr:hypothetical protein [Paenibacillus pectinilyticus]OCT14829.1 hypothetical protein A8709_11735 [Paenibacillus pectinilyticus]
MRLRKIIKMGQAVVVLVFFIGIMCPAPVAQASWLDRIKDIYQLPSNVEQIQKDYEATKQQLEDQKNKLTDAVEQSKAIEERLQSQNETLKKDNEQLQERIKAMEQVALDKDKRNRKIMYMIITAAALIIGYFMFGRVFRFIVWRRQKRGLR